MKYGKLTIIMLLFFIPLAIIFCVYDAHEIEMQKLEEIQRSIEQRNHLDSLYWEHLENYSFIHKDQISVGYQGYLYYKK
jgi:hypothetical protein